MISADLPVWICRVSALLVSCQRKVRIADNRQIQFKLGSAVIGRRHWLFNPICDQLHPKDAAIKYPCRCSPQGACRHGRTSWRPPNKVQLPFGYSVVSKGLIKTICKKKKAFPSDRLTGPNRSWRKNDQLLCIDKQHWDTRFTNTTEFWSDCEITGRKTQKGSFTEIICSRRRQVYRQDRLQYLQSRSREGSAVSLRIRSSVHNLEHQKEAIAASVSLCPNTFRPAHRARSWGKLSLGPAL